MLAGIFLSEQSLGIVHIPSVNRISLRIQYEAGIPQALVQIHLVGRVHETRTDSGHDSVVGVHSQKGDIGTLSQRQCPVFIFQKDNAV